MRQLFLFMMVSADGYFEGPKHDINWHNVDSEFVDFANKQLDEVDTLIFGRRTYELMASFWPSSEAISSDNSTAKRMNSLKKVVVSTSLKKADWHNTTLIKKDVVEDIRKLKQSDGKKLAVLGSSNLCLTLIKSNLLDSIRLMINPVILSQGTPIFDGLSQELKLSLNGSRSFESGNVLLEYSLVK